MFNLISINESNFISAHLGENNGSFIQSTIFFREQFSKNHSKDKHYFNTLNNNALNNNLLKKYNKKIVNQTDKTDLIDLEYITKFSKKFDNKKANFITATGNLKSNNKNIQEQEAYLLLLGEISCALKIQSKGGNFILKIFESFTELTIQILLILSSLYTDVFITKPFTSKKSSSEKYIVCKNFKGVDKKIILDLDKILKLNKSNKKKLNLINLLTNYTMSQEYKKIIIKANTTISNQQFININQIVDYIQKDNFRGDEYHKRREMQIKASEFWINKFFIQKKDFNKTIEEFSSNL